MTRDNRCVEATIIQETLPYLLATVKAKENKWYLYSLAKDVHHRHIDAAVVSSFTVTWRPSRQSALLVAHLKGNG
jgi:hypothetical protein